jgi:hypothetical protein
VAVVAEEEVEVFLVLPSGISAERIVWDLGHDIVSHAEKVLLLYLPYCCCYC